MRTGMAFRTVQNVATIAVATTTTSAITTPGFSAGNSGQPFYSLRAVDPGAAIPSLRSRSRACSASFDFG
jgi:hypothetical protein